MRRQRDDFGYSPKIKVTIMLMTKYSITKYNLSCYE
jgi:hypothetical protein